MNFRFIVRPTSLQRTRIHCELETSSAALREEALQQPVHSTTIDVMQLGLRRSVLGKRYANSNCYLACAR